MTAPAPGHDPGKLDRTVRAALQAWVDGVEVPALPGVKSPPDSRRGLVARMDALEHSHGGAKAAAAAAGVTPRTWSGWRKGGKPSRKSLSGLQGAYQADLKARAQTPARKRRQARLKASAGGGPHVKVRAEIQWDGYYNGNRHNVGSDRTPPDSDNRQAYRVVRFGRTPVRALLDAWSAGRDTGKALEDTLSSEYNGAVIWLNTYYHEPEVTISDDER